MQMIKRLFPLGLLFVLTLQAETLLPEALPMREEIIINDILYRSGEDLTPYMEEMCRLDLYLPPDRKAGFGTVIFIHSGGMYTGNKYIPERLRNQDYAVVAINYRLHPKVKAPAYIEDAAAAVAWVFQNIKKYGGDPDRIVITGVSAGGYLASLITLDKSWLATYEIDPDRLRGLASVSGQSITHFTVRKEMGIPTQQPIIDKWAPLFHVRKDAPPHSAHHRRPGVGTLRTL